MSAPTDRRSAAATDRLTWKLRERVKELTALHRTARALQGPAGRPLRALRRVARDLPRAWQHPDRTVVRIAYGAAVATSDGYRRPRTVLRVRCRTKGGQELALEVGYAGRGGSFLPEEAELQRSVLKLLRSHLERGEAERRLTRYYETLESTVADRTAQLKRANRELRREAARRRERERQVRRYRDQLRQLSSELLHAEEAERKRIASLLHDRIGQSLAIMKMRLDERRASCRAPRDRQWSSGFRQLLDETIRHARDLTNEISPPLLYEIGLAPALEWLGEHYQELFGYRVAVRCRGSGRAVDPRVGFVVYMAVRELLMNAAKHARASRVAVEAHFAERGVTVTVRDDGAGFDPSRVPRSSFGLFNIREQLGRFRGRMTVGSRPGRGCRVRLSVPRPARAAKGKAAS